MYSKGLSFLVLEQYYPSTSTDSPRALGLLSFSISSADEAKIIFTSTGISYIFFHERTMTVYGSMQKGLTLLAIILGLNY